MRGTSPSFRCSAEPVAAAVQPAGGLFFRIQAHPLPHADHPVLQQPAQQGDHPEGLVIADPPLGGNPEERPKFDGFGPPKHAEF